MAEYLRQQSLINQEKLSEMRIVIIGSGAIGSFTALALTKMGVQRMTLWDKDTVENHNISNQFYNKDALGLSKVSAVAAECKRFTPTGVDIESIREFYNGQSLDSFDVVIALTDNIEGRAAALEAAKKSEKCQLYIDGRMGAEIFRSFAFNPKSVPDAEKYHKDYIEGVVNEVLPCTARAIIYNVLMASSIISSYVKRHVNGEKLPFQFIFNFGDYSRVCSKME